MLLATGVLRPPTSYQDARKWLEMQSGIHLITRDERGESTFVVVGVYGRSAQARASSSAAPDVEAAFVKAVGTVAAKL